MAIPVPLEMAMGREMIQGAEGFGFSAFDYIPTYGGGNKTASFGREYVDKEAEPINSKSAGEVAINAEVLLNLSRNHKTTSTEGLGLTIK